MVNTLKKNRHFIIFFALLLVGVALVVLLSTFKKDDGGKARFAKYDANITISAKTKKGVETNSLAVRDDGENASIVADKFVNTAYILKNDLYYLQDDKYYIYTGEKSYRDFFKEVNALEKLDKIKESGEYTYYSKLCSVEELSELLKSLYFGVEISSPAVINIVKRDNFVVSVEISLANVGDYEKISVAVSFKELDEDFKVDTSMVLNQSKDVFGDRYEYEHTSKNIYEFVK